MIPSYPNPASGTATENPLRQTTGAGRSSSARSVLSPVPATDDRSTFSQLLSGELALTRSGRADSEDQRLVNRPAKEGPDADQEKFKADSHAGQAKTSPDPVRGAHPTSLDLGNSVPPEFLDAGLLAGALFSGGGYASLIHLGGTGGATEIPLTGISPTAGLSADVVAGLAADLTSGYSEKNGVQNLTVNLEPAHLGRVEVRLQAKGDHLSVRLVAANPEAEAALRENLKDLTEAVQVRTGRFQQVEVRVELKDTHDTRQDSAAKEHPDFQDQDSANDQDPHPENETKSGGNRETPGDSEPDGWAQEG